MKIRNKPLAISVLMIRPGEISPIEFKTLIHHHQPFHSVVIEQGDTPSFIIADMENQRSGAKIHRVPSVGSVGQKNGDPRIPVRDFYPEIVTDIFHVIMEDLYSEPQELRKLIRVLVIADATIWNIHSDIFSKRSSKLDLQIVFLPGDAYQIIGFIPADENALIIRAVGQIPENIYKKMQAA